MSRPSKRIERPRRILRLSLPVAACLAFLLGARGLSAVPLGVTEFSGDLYEFDLASSEYQLAVPLDPPVECGPLTGAGDTLFCADPEQFEGTWVRRIERSSASVVWEINSHDLPFPDGIAIIDTQLYVVAHESQPLRFYLLTLDPATGEELDRIELTELDPLQIVYALAARGSDLWILITGDFTG